MALTAAGVPETLAEAKDRLQKGPAHPYDGKHDLTSVEDWPVFKRDNRRSNYVPADVPAEISQQWAKPLGGQLTPPVIAGDRLFVASQENHQLYCLDAKTGEIQWQLTTDGSLDTPPTCYQGRLIFGTRAGLVCAVRADDGQLIWRFRAAPADCRLAAFGRLESPWPVHGSVLVMNDRVYCVAGRSMHLNSGLYVYVLDVNTGEILQQRNLAANTSAKGEVQGAVLPDVLVSDGDSISMRTMRFNPDDISEAGAPATNRLLAANDGGLRDGTWFNSAFWVYGNSRGQMLVFDEQTVYSIQAYNKFVTKSYPHDIFTPGQGYRLLAADIRSRPPAATGRLGKRRGGKPAPAVKWERRIAIRGEAMVLTNQHLYLAGAPDVVDEKDPWAAFENRKGGVLNVFSKQEGEKLGEFPLDSTPVYDGMAAAGGRIYLSSENGTMICFGK
jgi:outer membrane protein assembly factor BamB